jgi:hypothetical protein
MTGGLFNGFAMFGSRASAPWYWDGTFGLGAVKPLPGWLVGIKPRCVAPFNAHMFAGSLASSTSSGVQRVAWSDVAAVGTIPASWVATATNQAGDLELSTGAGPVQVMRGLGSNLMVYRTTGCWAITYVGRPYIYTARKVASEVGAASMNSVVEVRGQHVVLAPGDLVLMDGTSQRSIGENRVKSTLFAQVSEIGLRLAHVYSVAGSNEVVFCMPIGRDDGANLGYVWDFSADKWSLRDIPVMAHSWASYQPAVVLPSTWADDAGTWESDYRAWDAPGQSGFVPRAMGISATSAQAWLIDRGDRDEAGQPMGASVERTGLPLGLNADAVKLVRGIYPRFTASAGTVIECQVGAQLSASDPVLWEAPQQFTVGQSRRIDALSSGRYLAVRFSAVGAPKWGVAGFGVEFSMRGLQ